MRRFGLLALVSILVPIHAHAISYTADPLFQEEQLSSCYWTGPSVLAAGTAGTFQAYGRDQDNQYDPQLVEDGVHADWQWSGGNASASTTAANAQCTHGPSTADCSWDTPGDKWVCCCLDDDARFTGGGVGSASDDGTLPLQDGKVTVFGGPITSTTDDTSLYVWYPASENAGHQKTFSATSGQPSGTTYSWQIAQGADKAHIVGSTTLAQVTLEPDAPSASPGGDVLLRLTYTYGGSQAPYDLALSVRKPDAGNSSWALRSPSPRNELSGGIYLNGEITVYTVKDQLGALMCTTACWTEVLVRLNGTLGMGTPVVDLATDGNGQSKDNHVLMTSAPVLWGMPLQNVLYVEIDQRVTWNGWGATGGANPSTGLPAFWRFRIFNYTGLDFMGNLTVYVTVGAF